MSFTTSLRPRRAAAIGVLAVIAIAPLVGVSATAASAVSPTQVVNASPTWTRAFGDYNHPAWTGSPGVATLDGAGPSLVFGDEAGYIWALHASNGAIVKGWPYKGSSAVKSTPSVLGSGSSALLFIGTGESPHPSHGGYLALHANGKKAWSHSVYQLPHNRGGKRGLMSSIAVGSIQTSADVVGGAMGQMQYAINARKGTALKGFPWLQADTNFSTPAVADIFHTGHDYIIEGGDSTKGIAGSYHYKNGGHIRILKPTGNKGGKYLNSGLVCQYNSNEVVQSSPAVGPFLKGGATGIVSGTGTQFKSASDKYRVIAIDTACKKVWSRLLDSSTISSPALANVDGNGLAVVEETSHGTVYALNGATGATLWSTALHLSGVEGSVTTFEALEGGFQYILAPAVRGMYVLDGRTGAVIQHIAADLKVRNSATVTADPDGSIGITVAGARYNSKHKSMQTIVDHFTVIGSSGVTTVQTQGAWPMFHHDPQLSGYAPAAKG